MREGLLRRVSGKLAKQLEPLDPELVVIFGSLARGKFVVGLSDVDVLIVSRKFERVPILERVPLALQHLDLDLPVDVFCYTPDELFSEIKRMNFLVIDAIEYGIPVVDKSGLFNRAKSLLNEIKRRCGLRATSTGWVFSKRAILQRE